MTADPIFLHGGVAGLAVGDLILPPRTTGTRLHHDSRRAATESYDRGRVYVTTGLDYAQWYAYVRTGAVYRVRPIGQLRPDPDSNVAESWSCRRAEVLEVLVPAPAPLPEAFDGRFRVVAEQLRRRALEQQTLDAVDLDRLLASST